MVDNNLFFFEDKWFSNNPKIIGPDTNAFWMSSVVFDGARAINGFIPDLDLHCKRLIKSATAMGLKPHINFQEIFDLCCTGLKQLPNKTYYVRPAFFAEKGFVQPDPESTKFVLSIIEMPMPEFKAISVCLSSYKRPQSNMAPTDAKASCLYPNNARALNEANNKGFDNAIIKDYEGNIAELATANLWLVKNNSAITPSDNGTFLCGITRNRIKKLLSTNGIAVNERKVKFEEILEADEVFSTGNYGKVTPIGTVETTNKPIGPITRKAHKLYLEWSKKFPII
tara:strand:- start:1045 stop:1893 length:849 start_codon:yes stop_codon:yes gene_type:complete